MLIFYDITRLVNRRHQKYATGIDRIDINYACFLSKTQNVHFVYQHNNNFKVLLDKGLIAFLYDLWILKESKIDTDIEVLFILDVLKGQDVLSLQSFHKCREKKFYINVSHYFFNDFDAFLKFKRTGQLIFISYIHDLIPVEYPEYTKSKNKNYYSSLFSLALCLSDVIFTNSQATYDSIIRFCSVNKISLPDIYINHIGVEPKFIEDSFKHQDKFFSDNCEYFVYVSSIDARKNHILLLNIWREWSREQIKIPKLVFIGNRGGGNECVCNFLDNALFIDNYIIELNNLDDDQMMQVVKHSLGVLYPSFAEGWGMPIAEAIALNKPVICSDIKAHRESGQGLVTYLDPLDGLGWKYHIKHLYSLHQLPDYDKSVLLYSNYIFPTWANHFEFIMSKLDVVDYTEPMMDVPENIILNMHIDEDNIDWLSKIFMRYLSEKKVRKFIQNPIMFFEDSKFFMFKKFAAFLKRYK